MISIDRSSRHGTWIGVLLAMVVGAGLVWWWFSTENPSGGVQLSAAAQSASAQEGGAVVSSSTPPPAHVSWGPGADPDQGLKSVIAAGPNGEQELTRITTFLKFQRLFEQFQALDTKDINVKKASAQQLYDMLPDRVRQEELSIAEGMLLCNIFLIEIEPDETKRNVQLTTCGAALEKVAPKMDSDQQAKEVQCKLEYRRREAALVTSYQSDPPSQRNPSKLEKELNQARHDVFDSPTCGT